MTITLIVMVHCTKILVVPEKLKNITWKQDLKKY